ncbi:hypothetical protein FRC00_010740 [Tulasnella sp. 408]|nr:hypothetical protein FRC00_010740 [Tulasnella sp. 408]
MRPKFGTHEYCGRTCADEAKRKANSGGGLLGAITSPFWGGGGGDDEGAGRSSSQYPGRSTGGSSYGAMPPAAGSGDNLCEHCHAKPKYAEKDPRTGAVVIYPFCGRTCRNVNAQLNVQRCQLRDCGKPSQGQYCSDKHAKKAVQKGYAQACAYCKEYPANLPYEYCSKDCGMKDARERDRNASPLSLITQDKNNYISIARRLNERWDDPILAPPEIKAIFQISVSKKYENRFKEAVSAAERLGGSTTKSAFYGGQCICDLGVPQFGTDQLCSWGSCSICIVIRKCFDVLEFNLPHHTGDLGKGIYANLNPAKANRFTVRKSNHEIRAMILCSIIQVDDYVQGDKKKHSAFIDETGRVFCANKDVILPRQLILYKTPEPRAILQ